MKNKKKYRNPPIQEAIFEAKFAYDGYDSALPGQFFERVRLKYPNKKDISPITIVLGTPQGTNSRLPQTPVMQAWKENNSELIQVGPGIVAANRLAYSSWEDFIPAIREILDAYISSAKPRQLERVGVRFINRFVIPEENMNFSEYFTLGIQPPSTFFPMEGFDLSFLHKLRSHSQKYEFEMRTKFMTAALKKEEIGNCFILDMDCYLVSVFKLDVEQLVSLATDAHDIIEQVFESLLTDKTRHLMGVE